MLGLRRMFSLSRPYCSSAIPTSRPPLHFHSRTAHGLLSRSDIRAFSSCSTKLHDRAASQPGTPTPSSETPAASPDSQTNIQLETSEPRLSLTFTCTVEACHTRSTHEFTKRSYTKGIVIVQCPGCNNRHLIADHLGWFKESTEDGKLRTVEDLVRAKGEKVRRGRVDAGGVVEYAPE
ncbi:DNL zinc finger-domain-containing protein [Daedaleopsis nitida]|nr:DNL zinc finger-domain-containing protein [Daedaleopsis nitida]